MALGVPNGVGKAACSEPAALALVDAAFDRSGGVEADRLKREFCSRCEIAAECFTAAMATGEYGVWGGTGKKIRTKHGAPPPPANYHNHERTDCAS